MNRKQRRALEKEMGKKKTQDITEMMSMFDQLPDECNACTAPFDKTDRKMVSTWNVVVRQPDTVRLYCPDCWKMAMKVVSELGSNER